MKPMSPEDRELEKMSSEVSGRYRAAAQDEPPARVDAAVLAAARREVEQRRDRRAWRMPASIAAMLVIGVSLVLIVRENEPSLPSLDRPAADEAKLAKSAPPQLAMEAKPKAMADATREDRPSRERGPLLDRVPVARDEAVATQNHAASGITAAAPASVPATAPVAGPPSPAEQEHSGIAESGDVASGEKAQPQAWLGKIDDLLRDGKEPEARRQLLDFRKQYPDYRLPERLQALLPADQR